MYNNVSCFVGPPIPLKKIIIHEILHEICIFLSKATTLTFISGGNRDIY